VSKPTGEHGATGDVAGGEVPYARQLHARQLQDVLAVPACGDARHGRRRRYMVPGQTMRLVRDAIRSAVVSAVGDGLSAEAVAGAGALAAERALQEAGVVLDITPRL
jgi:hypothetical protein